MRQRYPGEPAAVGSHVNRETVDRQHDITTPAAHTPEQERRILCLDRLGGVGIDDGDVDWLAGTGGWSCGGRLTTGCGRSRAARRGDKQRDTDESHVAQGSVEQ